jgi:flagellar hook-basal body complex protein FliE
MESFAVEPVGMLTDAMRTLHSSQANQADFGQWLVNQVEQADSSIKQAELQVQQMALGEADNLHQVMIALSSAKTSFELTVQIRNKLLEGFQEVMRMSV